MDLVELVLDGLSRELAKPYSHTGRPSMPPEHLLKATLLQAFFTVRSERQLMEQINYNILFRWFVGFRWMTVSGTLRHFRRTGNA